MAVSAACGGETCEADDDEDCDEEEEEEWRRSGEDPSFYGYLHLVHRQELLGDRWSLLVWEQNLTSWYALL